jgi:hypothetical protein
VLSLMAPEALGVIQRVVVHFVLGVVHLVCCRADDDVVWANMGVNTNALGNAVLCISHIASQPFVHGSGHWR